MNTMRPEPDDASIRLPVTFDYSGGRADNKKGNILTTIVLTVISIILIIGFARNENMEWYIRIIVCAVVFSIYMMFIRFKVFRERTYSDAYETLKEIDYTPSTNSFWGIYDIDLDYPYICHFKDGKKGIFIKMEKDIVVGKPDTIMYDHFEAISDAYCLAGSLNINLAHIDYMDNVGNDPRMQTLYDGLDDCENPDMRDIMLSIYSNLQEEMSNDYASFDVYLLTTKSKVNQLWHNAQAICEKLLTGNYLSYRVLDSDGIRATTMALFNLKEFSVLDACENVLQQNARARGIVAISIEHADGTVEKLNKTQQEITDEINARKEAERQAILDKEREKQERHERRRVKREEKKKKKPVTYEDAIKTVSSEYSDEQVDLFSSEQSVDSNECSEDLDLF